MKKIVCCYQHLPISPTGQSTCVRDGQEINGRLGGNMCILSLISFVIQKYSIK